MAKTLLILALLVPFGASAQGFANNDMGTCYSWQGGNFSAGIFTKCNPELQPFKAKAVLPPPVVASPVMMPMAAPVSCAPEPKTVKRIVKKKPLPKKC